MRPSSPALIYAGVAVVTAGFGLIAFTWSRVAGLTAVPLQIPYLVSGGMVGLGLILIGLTLINLQTRRAEGARRDRQLEQLSELLDEIRVLLGGERDLQRSITTEPGQAEDSQAGEDRQQPDADEGRSVPGGSGSAEHPPGLAPDDTARLDDFQGGVAVAAPVDHR